MRLTSHFWCHRKIEQIISHRRSMILTRAAILANILDHRYSFCTKFRTMNISRRYRGQALEVGERSGAYRELPLFVDDISLALSHPPALDNVLDFVSQRGMFANCQDFDCSPYRFWSALFPAEKTALFPTLVVEGGEPRLGGTPWRTLFF